MMRKLGTAGAALTLLTALSASPASAAIIYSQAAGGTGNNVLFKCPDSGGDPSCAAELTNDNDILIGTIQNSIYQTRFDADVNILPGAAGQATIKEVVETDNWASLDLDWINFDSTNEVILRVKPTDKNTTIILSACDQFGNCTSSSPDFTGIDSPEGAFFTIGVDGTSLITSVSVSAFSSLGVAGGLSEVEQVRLGDLLQGDDVVLAPEPATLLLLGTGFLVTGYRARRRFSKSA